ncbi:MAG: hypothetical protein E6066_15850 [Oscillospiraceae bacterium]|nr:hypothetical protein [Oscillospiraceae bacterium]
MQKSVKKSNKKTGAAGKYTASGAFGGAQPSNLVELIEAQRGKAASSAGKKPAADTALANEWANLQLQSFGQFGADPAAIVGQQAGQTVGGWLHSSAAKPKDTALANEWANLQLQSFGQFGADPAAIAGQQAGQTAGGWLRSSAAKPKNTKPKNTALANEWANLQLQSFGQFGADPAAIAGQQAGQTAGDWLENQLAQTGFNEDESKLAYLGEKFTNGAHRAVEGAYNNAIDNSRAQVDAQLRNGFVTDTGVNQRDIQNALASIFGGKYAQHAQDTQAADLAVAAELSGAADGLRSTRAAEYGRDIDERYGATGLWKLGGDVAAGAGQMLPTIGINAVTGGTMGMPWLFSSAAGNAAAQARAGGADEETAFLYGILSGGVEAATERISAGIPGLNKTGLLDDVLSRVASSPTGRGAVKKLVDVLGEGAEEYISEIAGAYLAKLWNGDERGAWQTFVETQPDALYAGLVGTLTSAVMNLPGEAYALARKNKPGAVPDAQQSGNSVPRLFTRDEVQGMSAREVSENYDAIRESMGLWDKDGELPENMPESGTVDVPAVDSESPAGDNGENIDFYVAPNGKVLPAEYKGWIGTNRRESLINSVDDARLRKMIGEVYRPSSVIGDGGTADSIRFERETGRLLSKSGHSQKAQNMLVYFQKLKDSGNLSDKDLKVVTELLNDLRKALEEKG